MTSSDPRSLLDAVKRELAHVYEDEDIDLWLDTPHPLLGYARARDLIEQGDDRPLQIASALATGAYL